VLQGDGDLSGWQAGGGYYALQFQDANAIRIGAGLCVVQPEACIFIAGALTIYIAAPYIQEAIQPLDGSDRSLLEKLGYVQSACGHNRISNRSCSTIKATLPIPGRSRPPLPDEPEPNERPVFLVEHRNDCPPAPPQVPFHFHQLWAEARCRKL
jgi:hypothetical protein